jgi:hypothetical protein
MIESMTQSYRIASAALESDVRIVRPSVLRMRQNGEATGSLVDSRPKILQTVPEKQFRINKYQISQFL